MIQTVLFFILTVLAVFTFVGLLILTVYCAIVGRMKKITLRHLIRLRKTMIFFAVTMILNAGLITLSQLTASTPRIVDENGNTPLNSIAELRALELNGRKQWISLRGWDKNAPVMRRKRKTLLSKPIFRMVTL